MLRSAEDRYIDTPRGVVRIRVGADREFLSGLELASGMGVFSGPNYPASREHKALVRLAGNPDSIVTVACVESGGIVGFIAIAPPSETERWSRLKDRGLVEAMAIEVSSEWRSMGIADLMVEALLEEVNLEDKILIVTGYSWHWDLEGLDVSKARYRNILLRFLEKAGFVYFDTDEPNIALDPANFFAARIGSEVGPGLYEAFDDLLFRESSWAEMRGRPRSIQEEMERWKSKGP